MFWNRQIQYIQKQIEGLSKDTKKSHGDIEKRLDNIEKVSVKQEVNLETHSKRAYELETIVITDKEKYQVDMKEIRKHINMIDGGLKLLGIVGTIVGIVGGIAKLVGLI